MVPCKHCGGEVAKVAKMCPHCGADIAGELNANIMGGCLMMAVVFGLAIGIISSC